jgi:DDE superfamily endonuclease
MSARGGPPPKTPEKRGHIGQDQQRPLRRSPRRASQLALRAVAPNIAAEEENKREKRKREKNHRRSIGDEDFVNLRQMRLDFGDPNLTAAQAGKVRTRARKKARHDEEGGVPTKKGRPSKIMAIGLILVSLIVACCAVGRTPSPGVVHRQANLLHFIHSEHMEPDVAISKAYSTPAEDLPIKSRTVRKFRRESWANEVLSAGEAVPTEEDRVQAESDFESVFDFFARLEVLTERYNLHRDHIWNMDESGVSLDHHTKQAGRVVSALDYARRTATVTLRYTSVVGVVNAGEAIPPLPFIVHPSKATIPGPAGSDTDDFDSEDDMEQRKADQEEQREELFDYLPDTSDNGWVKGKNYQKFVLTLIDAIKKARAVETAAAPRSAKRPVQWHLVILDGCSIHDNIEARKMLRDNHIHMLYLPAHLSHIMQPLDVAVFGPFKKRLKDLIQAMLLGDPHGSLREFDVAQAIARAYVESATQSNGQAGFRGAGLHPLDIKGLIRKLVCFDPELNNEAYLNQMVEEGMTRARGKAAQINFDDDEDDGLSQVLAASAGAAVSGRGAAWEEGEEEEHRENQERERAQEQGERSRTRSEKSKKKKKKKKTGSHSGGSNSGGGKEEEEDPKALAEDSGSHSEEEDPETLAEKEQKMLSAKFLQAAYEDSGAGHRARALAMQRAQRSGEPEVNPLVNFDGMSVTDQRNLYKAAFEISLAHQVGNTGPFERVRGNIPGELTRNIPDAEETRRQLAEKFRDPSIQCLQTLRVFGGEKVDGVFVEHSNIGFLSAQDGFPEVSNATNVVASRENGAAIAKVYTAMQKSSMRKRARSKKSRMAIARTTTDDNPIPTMRASLARDQAAQNARIDAHVAKRVKDKRESLLALVLFNCKFATDPKTSPTLAAMGNFVILNRSLVPKVEWSKMKRDEIVEHLRQFVMHVNHDDLVHMDKDALATARKEINTEKKETAAAKKATAKKATAKKATAKKATAKKATAKKAAVKVAAKPAARKSRAKNSDKK